MSGPPTCSQRGFSLVAAIFLIVVLAALGVLAVRIAATQEQAADLTLLELRAVAAAKAGIEYGANLAARGSICPLPAAQRTVSPPGAAFSGFTVTVTCALAPHALKSGTCNSYQIASTAVSGAFGRPDYVVRSATRVIKSCAPLSEQ